jgi:hypothetical protein
LFQWCFSYENMLGMSFKMFRLYLPSVCNLMFTLLIFIENHCVAWPSWPSSDVQLCWRKLLF